MFLQYNKTENLKTAEIELVWSINARIFYFGQRRWIFDVPIEDDVDEMIRLTIDHFMAGARGVLPQIVLPSKNPQKPVRKSQKS